MPARRWVPPVVSGFALASLATLSLAVVPLGSAARTPHCGGLSATIVGTRSADTLTGTRGPDVIAGRGGNDTIDGLGGNDTICGNAASDRLLGGGGDDALYGGRDRRDQGPGGSYLLGDVLMGGAGHDFLDGGLDTRRADARRRPDTYSWAQSPAGVTVDLSGTSTAATGVATGEGTDTIVLGPAHGIVGSAYADLIEGSPGDDRVDGGPGPDTISTGRGDDHVFPDGLEGASGNDVVTTGRGRDFVSSLSGRDRIAAGRGKDFVEAYSTEPAAVSLGPGRDYVGAKVTPGSGAEAQGGRGDDVIAYYGDLLAGQKPRARFTIDYRTGITDASGSITATGTIGGFEGHRLLGPLRWRFQGVEAAERVWAIQGGPLRARSRDGADELIGTPRDDLLDGGDGADAGYRRGGDDECRDIERGDC